MAPSRADGADLVLDRGQDAILRVVAAMEGDGLLEITADSYALTEAGIAWADEHGCVAAVDAHRKTRVPATMKRYADLHGIHLYRKGGDSWRR